MPRTAESHRLKVESLTTMTFASSLILLAENVDEYTPAYRAALLREAARRAIRDGGQGRGGAKGSTIR